MSQPLRKLTTIENPRNSYSNSFQSTQTSRTTRTISTNINDTILHGYFADTSQSNTTSFQSTATHKHEKSIAGSIGHEKISELIKKLAHAEASNDPFFNPSSALAILDSVKGKLIKKGQGNLARLIEQDENLFLESYARGMHVHSLNHTANESIYRRSKRAHAELISLRGRIEQLQTARLQLELRMNWLREINTGESIQINTLQRFKAWADKEIDMLNYKDITADELQFIANALQEYAKGIAKKFYAEESRKNKQMMIHEYLSIKNGIGAIDKEQKEINTKIRELEKDEIILRDREAITNKPNTPLPSFPLDTLNYGETYVLRTDKFERCVIESLSAPFEKEGTVYYTATMSWKVHEGMTTDSKQVLLRAPLLGFLDIRDITGRPIDYLTGRTYGNSSRRIILPKILSKTKTAISAKPIPLPPEKPVSLMGKIKNFFGKIFR